MKKTARNFVIICTILFLFFAGITAAAAAAPGNYIKNTDVITTDVYTAGQTVTNDGTVKGDFIAAGSDVNSNGSIDGDYICAGSNVGLTGQVYGDMRAAADTVTISGDISKNLTSFARTTNITEGAIIGRNIAVFSQYINIKGTVKGNSTIYGEKIVLGGEFFGDVNVNLGDQENMSSTITLTILPGTKIQGTLLYKSVNEAVIPPDAQINGLNWIKANEAEAVKKTAGTGFTLSDYIKRSVKFVLTTAVYFLIGILLLKLFPTVFIKQADAISEKPWSTLGKGAAAILLSIAFFMTFALLLFLSIWIISPSVPLVFASTITACYVVLFYLSTMPVSLWLGNRLFNDKYNVTARFGLGLAIITFGTYVLKLLTGLPGSGFVFSISAGAINLAVVLFGTGAILTGIHSIYRAVRNL